MSRSSFLRAVPITLLLVTFAGVVRADPQPDAPWGLSLGAGPDRRFGEVFPPVGAGRLYATVALWKNVDRMQSVGVEGAWLGADELRVVYTFYRQAGPVIIPERDFRRTRWRWTRVGLQARRHGRDSERGPFGTLGAAAYFQRTVVRDEVSVPSDPSVPVQTTETVNHATWAGVNAGGGVLWGGPAVHAGVFARVDWAFARDRTWLAGGLMLDFH